MRRIATVFLQVFVVLVGVGVLTFLLWEPHLEGRNAQATVWEIYFQDPFLAYIYFASIAFFVALYQAFQVLGYAGRNSVFSPAAVRAVRTIKFCALALVGFVAIGELFILWQDDDGAGAVTMGIVIMFSSSVIAATAAMCERILQAAVDLKTEQDLTV